MAAIDEEMPPVHIVRIRPGITVQISLHGREVSFVAFVGTKPIAQTALAAVPAVENMDFIATILSKRCGCSFNLVKERLQKAINGY